VPKFNDTDYDTKNSDYNRVKHYTFVRGMSPKGPERSLNHK
jgi:hypothetical protein